MNIYGFEISLNEIISGKVKEESFDSTILNSFPHSPDDVKNLVKSMVCDIKIYLEHGRAVLYKQDNSKYFISRYGICDLSREEIIARHAYSRELTKKEFTTILLKYTLKVYDI